MQAVYTHLFYILTILLLFLKLKFSNVKQIFIYLLWKNYTRFIQIFKYFLIVL